ncbi:MAG TPA: hypothetical protein VGC30_10385 [Dokdonella sp.]
MTNLGSTGMLRAVSGAILAAGVAALIGLGLAAASNAAAAASAGVPAAPPWTDGLPFADTYAFDPQFNGSGYFFDRFAGRTDADYLGRKIAKLDDGSYVVAGLLPRPGTSAPADQLGLVHYSATGERLVWPDADAAYSVYGGQYVVYPQGTAGQPPGSFLGVAGVQAYGGYIYVLTTEYLLDGSQAERPTMLVFSAGGAWRQWVTYHPGGDVKKPAVGFTIDRGTNRLIVLGDDYNGGSYRQFWLSAYAIGAGGALTFDGGFGFPFYAAPSAVCAAGAVVDGHCSMRAAAITTAGTQLTFPQLAAGFYVAATRTWQGLDTDMCVIRLSSSGAPSTSFGNDGHMCISFDDGGSQADAAAAIVRHSEFTLTPPFVRDHVYVSGSVERSQRPGVGVFELDGGGELVPAFGGSGLLLFGGCGSGAGNCDFDNRADTPYGMTFDGDALAIAGVHTKYGSDNSVAFVNGMLAVIGATDGGLRNFRDYSTQQGETWFLDVVPDGGGRYVVGGDARIDADGGRLVYLTARLQPDDTIFHDGFD